MHLNRVIKERRSIRRFSKGKKADWRDIIECIDFARYAPMAGNKFTLKFIIVDDKDKIKKISEFCQQPFVGTADYIVIACTDPSLTQNAYEQFADKFCRQQAGAAIQNFLLKITEKGLATCWVGYFAEELIKEELRIPPHVSVEAVFPVGYESEVKGAQSKKLKKTDIDQILYFHKYKNKKMNSVKKIEV
ncbi:MAG: nitroreductase family protein [archaeon]